MRLALAVAAVLCLAAATARADDDLAAIDATFDANFVCPETLASDDVRIDELHAYMAWAKDRHPDWTLRKRLDVRFGLLRRHACAETLANLAASERPPVLRP